MEISVSMPHVIHSLESPSHSIRYKQAPKKATLFWLGGTITSYKVSHHRTPTN